MNSPSEELGLNEERSLTVRRFPNSENGPSQATRRQSTPEQGNKGEPSSSDFLSASVSSPGYLSHASDLGESIYSLKGIKYVLCCVRYLFSFVSSLVLLN